MALTAIVLSVVMSCQALEVGSERSIVHFGSEPRLVVVADGWWQIRGMFGDAAEVEFDRVEAVKISNGPVAHLALEPLPGKRMGIAYEFWDSSRGIVYCESTACVGNGTNDVAALSGEELRIFDKATGKTKSDEQVRDVTDVNSPWLVRHNARTMIVFAGGAYGAAKQSIWAGDVSNIRQGAIESVWWICEGASPVVVKVGGHYVLVAKSCRRMNADGTRTVGRLEWYRSKDWQNWEAMGPVTKESDYVQYGVWSDGSAVSLLGERSGRPNGEFWHLAKGSSAWEMSFEIPRADDETLHLVNEGGRFGVFALSESRLRRVR